MAFLRSSITQDAVGIVRGRGVWLPVLIALYMPVFVFQSAMTTLSKIAHHEGFAVGVALTGPVVARVAPFVGAELAVLMLAGLLMSMASRELTAPEWDLEWLVTLPLPRRTLLGVRILERTLVNPPALSSTRGSPASLRAKRPSSALPGAWMTSQAAFV